MKLTTKFHILVLFFIVVIFSCQSNAQQSSTKKTVDITPTEFKAAMTKESTVILDVRTPKEVAQGIIPGAKVLNFYDNNFKTELGKLDKNKTYLVYCKSGGRSGKVCKALENAGITNYHNLEGGITAWRKAGLETVQQ